MDALPEAIASRLDEVRALCEKYRVKRLTLFGSAVKGTFDPKRSDVDFVVEFLPDAPRAGFDGAYFQPSAISRISSNEKSTSWNACRSRIRTFCRCSH